MLLHDICYSGSSIAIWANVLPLCFPKLNVSFPCSSSPLTCAVAMFRSLMFCLLAILPPVYEICHSSWKKFSIFPFLSHPKYKPVLVPHYITVCSIWMRWNPIIDAAVMNPPVYSSSSFSLLFGKTVLFLFFLPSLLILYQEIQLQPRRVYDHQLLLGMASLSNVNVNVMLFFAIIIQCNVILCYYNTMNI